MIAEFKFLFDTNIVIGLEDNHQVDERLSELLRLCRKHKIGVFISAANFEDVSRDINQRRKEITNSKLKKFEKIQIEEFPSAERLSEKFGLIKNVNDKSDCELLFCIEKDCADFLITEDRKLRKRANNSGYESRALSVNDALDWIRQTFEPRSVKLPHIFDRKAYDLNESDPIFASLRDDYDGFDDWFKKCKRSHRDCWVIEVEKRIAGILIRKTETKEESGVVSEGEKVFKICTFKMAVDFRGEKFGEQLLKKVLWYAQSNKFDVVYTTTFPKQEALLSLLEAYGFRVTKTQQNGELYVEKVIKRGLLLRPDDVDPLSFAREVYPRFLDDERVAKFCVPIQSKYHQKLFPEIAKPLELPLFSQQDLPLLRKDVVGEPTQTPGNTIRKVYLSRASTKELSSGDLVFFYHSKDVAMTNSQSITSIGIVEGVTSGSDVSALTRLTAKRSVFSQAELSNLSDESDSPVKVMNFLLLGHIMPTIGLNSLIESGVFTAAPQSTAKIHQHKYASLKKLFSVEKINELS